MKKNNSFDKVWVSGATKPKELKKISNFANVILFSISIAIIVFGVVVTMYSDVLGVSDNSYNTSIALIIVLLALVVARFTNQGRSFWTFFQASKLELVKVVWPTYKETMAITAMVIAIVIVFALIISLFGVIFENFIQYFLG